MKSTTAPPAHYAAAITQQYMFIAVVIGFCRFMYQYHVMQHLTPIKDFLLDVFQGNQSSNIDSEGTVVQGQETQTSNEAPSNSSSFYLISEGIMKVSSMPSKNESTPEPEMSSLSRQLDELELDDLPSSRTRYPDKFRGKLELELERLQIREAKMTRRINDRKQRLKKLEARDEEEKWEDDLFETRMKELEGANAIIETRSPVSREDIINQVRKVNEKIIHISSVVIGVRSMRPHAYFLSDSIANALGHSFLSYFQTSGLYFDEKQTIKALLQIYLAQSSTSLICSWYPERYLNQRLDQLYNRIVVNESQAIAGKWRQMAFKQLPHDPDKRALQHFTIEIVDMILAMASYAGWRGGDISEIKDLVQELMANAEIVQEYAKAGVISANIQAWTAYHGDMYDPVTMEGPLHGTGTRSRVLGSTGIGLRVCCNPRDEDAAFETLLPSKVFCIRG